MFNSSSSSSHSYGDTFMHRPPTASFSTALPAVPTQIPRGSYVDGNGGSFPPFAVAASSSSPPSYSSSLPSSYYIHRSISSHSLPLHLQVPEPLNPNAFFSSSSPSPHQLPLPPLSSSPSSSSGDFLEFSSGPMRRVFSTGDLQGMNGSPPPPSGDNYSQDGGGAFSQRVGRYSAEERKERIERYRVKRHQRNFNKKITYACRKTLADSRPRVKGRFARNGETEAEADAELEREVSDNSYKYCNYHDHANSSNGNSSSSYYYSHRDSSAAIGFGDDNGEWWRRMPATTAAGNDSEPLGFYDDELWASLADVLSVNLTS